MTWRLLVELDVIAEQVDHHVVETVHENGKVTRGWEVRLVTDHEVQLLIADCQPDEPLARRILLGGRNFLEAEKIAIRVPDRRDARSAYVLSNVMTSDDSMRHESILE